MQYKMQKKGKNYFFEADNNVEFKVMIWMSNLKKTTLHKKLLPNKNLETMILVY